MRSRIALLTLVLVAVAVLAVGCAPSAVTKFDAAKISQGKGEYAEAIANFESFIAENEASGLRPYALYNIAHCQRGLYKKAEALAAYQKVIDQFPASEPAQWAKVEMARLKKIDLVPPPPKPVKKPKTKGPKAKGSETK